MADSRTWVLKQAAEPGGFAPVSWNVRHFALSIERDGALERKDKRSPNPRWFITAAGRAELAALKG